MKKISKYLLLLAAAVFTFTACEKTVERDPSPLDQPGAVMFASAGGSVELNMSKEPLETTVSLFRTSNIDKADTIQLKVEADPVFVLDPKVIFAPGDKQVDLKIAFPTGEADNTYSLKLTLPEDKLSPYLAGQSEFNYTVKLVLWSEVRTGVWEDATIGPAFNLQVTAWYVQYQVADQPDGSQKIRIINPYRCLPTGADAEGIYDGFPYNEDGDVDFSKDYNFLLNIAVDGEVRFPEIETFLGISWSTYTDMAFFDYAASKGNPGTYGHFDAEKSKIVFDAQDNTMITELAGSLYGIQVNFQFYLSKAAYLADQTEPEGVDATVETYEGSWQINGLDINAEEDVPVSANVTVTSYEDPTDGQYYVLEGLYPDMPVVYGTFDETTHVFHIEPTKGSGTVEIEGTTYIPYLYMVDAQWNITGSVTLDIAPAEDGGLETYDESNAIGFIIVYRNPLDSKDNQFGDGMFNISFAAIDAASAPARKAAAAKRVSGKKMLFAPMDNAKIR